ATDGPAARAAHHEPGGDRIVERERLRPQVAGELIAAAGRVAEPETLRGLGPDAALGEVGAAARALWTAQRAAEERGGRLADRDQRFGRGPAPRGFLGHRQAKALRHGAHRLGEGERLGLHDDGEHVALLAAAGAAVEAALLAPADRQGL